MSFLAINLEPTLCEEVQEKLARLPEFKGMFLSLLESKQK